MEAAVIGGKHHDAVVAPMLPLSAAPGPRYPASIMIGMILPVLIDVFMILIKLQEMRVYVLCFAVIMAVDIHHVGEAFLADVRMWRDFVARQIFLYGRLYPGVTGAIKFGLDGSMEPIRVEELYELLDQRILILSQAERDAKSLQEIAFKTLGAIAVIPFTIVIDVGSAAGKGLGRVVTVSQGREQPIEICMRWQIDLRILGDHSKMLGAEPVFDVDVAEWLGGELCLLYFFYEIIKHNTPLAVLFNVDLLAVFCEDAFPVPYLALGSVSELVETGCAQRVVQQLGI